jgi:sugar phosphate isomerase/epimerase
MRPITLATGQFGDLSLEEVCKLAKEIGYNGLELATHAHFDVKKGSEDDEYIEQIKSLLLKYDMKCYAISSHLAGQCVGSEWDQRLDNFVPVQIASQPTEIRKWAIEEMKLSAKAAHKLNVGVITGFMGSPIWNYWYSFPQTSQQMVNTGYEKILELWTPIFDVFDEYGVKFALEVHPTEIAFDYYTTEKLLQTFNHRKTLGINYDPSHLVWQGVNELVFLRDFSEKVFHVHMKDVKITKNDKASLLGSHIEFGDSRRGWNFVSLGHGDVDFDGIIRELNIMKYSGPLSVEWEDSGMERLFGAKESYQFTSRMNFSPSDIAFDSTLKQNSK